MLDEELLALLVCPVTHQDVALATPQELVVMNDAIREGRIRTAKGAAVDQPLQGALIRQDRTIAYAIRDGIPVMLAAEGLALGAVKWNGHA